MNEILLLIDFNCPHIHQIALNLRLLGVYTQIIPFHHTLPFSPEIKGIIFVGIPNTSIESFNLDSLDIPILGIESGSWSLASSFGIELSTEIHEISTDISQNWIPLHFQTHPLLIGLESGSTIPIKRIRNLIGKNLISLGLNQTGMTTIFQITGKQCYGLQYCPNMESSIWRNFLHLCNFNYIWQIPNILSTLQNQLKETLTTQDVIIPYSGGVKSTILALLLSTCIPPKNLKLKLINTGFFHLHHIESSLETMKGLGIDVNVIEIDCLSNPPQIPSIITQAFQTHAVIVPTLLTESNLPWKKTILQPFRHLYRDELLSIGNLLDLSATLLRKHYQSPLGLSEGLLTSISYPDLEKLKLIDFKWTNYLIRHNYYYQIYSSTAFWINNNIYGLKAIDKLGKSIPLPSEFLIEFGREIKDEFHIELVYLI